MVDVGPKFSGPELDKVERMVDAAVGAGAEVLTGGRRLTERRVRAAATGTSRRC